MTVKKDELNRFADVAEKVLLDCVKTETDMRPCIGVFKDSECYAWVMPDMHEGAEEILQAAHAIIVGMEPDFILIANDTLIAKGKNFAEDEDGKKVPCKRDGTPWERGEMQKAREQNTEDAQDILDNLMVQYYDREGAKAMISRIYTVKDHEVVWDGERDIHVDGESGGAWSGRLPDHISRFFTLKTVRQLTTELAALEGQVENFDFDAMTLMGEAPGMSPTEAMQFLQEHPKEAYAHQCCAVLKVALLPQGCGFALGTNDKEIVEVFQRSFKDYPGIVMDIVGGEG